MKNQLLLMTTLCLIAPLQAQQQEPPVAFTADEVVARFKTPTTITLQAQDATVAEVFESFMKQAGTPHKLQGSSGSEKMSIDVQKQPFWDAALAFMKASGRQLSYVSSGGNDESRFSLNIGTYGGGLKAASGPLTGYVMSVQRLKTTSEMLVFSEVFRTRRNEQEGKAENDQLKLRVGTFLDPAVPVVVGSAELSLLEAIGENGRSILTPGSGARGGDWTLESVFTSPSEVGAGKKITSLKVGYRAFVGLDPQILTFENVTEGATQKQAGLRGEATENYEVVEAKTLPAGLSLSLRANRPNDGMDFNRAGSNLFKDVTLIDGTGKQWKGRLGSASDRTGVSNPAIVRQYEARIAFGRPGDTFPAPLKVVWTVPSKFQPFETVLEWKDVPLP